MEQQTHGDSQILTPTVDPSKVIQTHCPICEKKYLVSTESLAYGQAQFQCRSCQGHFAINWFGERSLTPGEVNLVPAFLLESQIKPQKCAHCGKENRQELKFCSSCGIEFKKAKKLVESEALSFELTDPDLLKLWEQVRANYASEDAHQIFVKACFEGQALAAAGQCYATILKINPTDPTAKKMQKLIVSMTEMKPDQFRSPDKISSKTKFNLYKFTVIICILSIGLGALFEALRPMIALGSSILFFSIIVHHWITSTEI